MRQRETGTWTRYLKTEKHSSHNHNITQSQSLCAALSHRVFTGCRSPRLSPFVTASRGLFAGLTTKDDGQCGAGCCVAVVRSESQVTAGCTLLLAPPGGGNMAGPGCGGWRGRRGNTGHNKQWAEQVERSGSGQGQEAAGEPHRQPV